MTILPKFLNQKPAELELSYRKIKSIQAHRLGPTASPEWSIDTGFHHTRNRYSSIVPYDKTRVHLKVAHGFDDYINASHLNVDLQRYATRAKRYIASQGPTRGTTDIFWQMCYDEIEGDSIVIVMVTPLEEFEVERCFKYWPEKEHLVKGGEAFFGRDLLLRKTRVEEVDGEFVVSQFSITDTKTGNEKQVYHLHYDKWQDFSRPIGLEPVKKLSERANRLLATETDPIIVHCSAGVGRSGTFITLDYMLTCCKLFTVDPVFEAEDGTDLIKEVVYQLREQRLLMVERFEQYLFIYESLKRYYLDNNGKSV